MQRVHPLKDPWFVFYIPALKPGQDYADRSLDELDYVDSLESAFAVLNTLPHPTVLPADDDLVFARKKVTPTFESFPHGFRITVFTKTKAQGETIILHILAAVLGEDVCTCTQGESVCDVVRISRKPGNVYKEALKIEVWLHSSKHNEEVTNYFKKLTQVVPGVSVVSRSLN